VGCNLSKYNTRSVYCQGLRCRLENTVGWVECPLAAGTRELMPSLNRNTQHNLEKWWADVAEGARTLDLRITSTVLYLLSYRATNHH
jgi:hypothetical protein